MGFNAYQEVILSSKGDDEIAILSVFGEVLKNDPEGTLTLLNIYKELPISNSATIFDIKSKNIEFRTVPLQLAAMSYCNEAVIMAPFLNCSVLGRVVYLDTTHQLVSLGDFAYAEVHVDKRTAVRVRMKVPINVNLHADGTRISGVMRDVSLGGCCVTTTVGSLVESCTTLTLHLKMIHNNAVLETHIPTRVVRVEGGPPFNCAMAFDHTAETEKVLSAFIYQRQLEIIRELKDKC